MVSLLVQYLLGHQNIRHNLESSDATDFDKITVALRNQVPLCWFTVAMFLKLPVNLASIDFFYDDFLLAILAIEFVKMVGSPLIPATASCIYRACQQAEKKQPSA